MTIPQIAALLCDDDTPGVVRPEDWNPALFRRPGETYTKPSDKLRPHPRP